MERVNELILDRAGSDVEMIPEVARHLIDSGGKRLRPMLTLAVGRDVRLSRRRPMSSSRRASSSCTRRRSSMTTWSTRATCAAASSPARMVWGNQASVLVGDFLLGQAFKMMVEVGSLEALDILSNAAAVIAEGEVMQLAAAKNMATTEDEYLAVIAAKTAALFSAAAEVGPIIAGRGRDDRAAFRSYGTNLGLAFQLIDDALDYGGSSADLGKHVGDDFREGKITLPVVLSYRRGSDEDRDLLGAGPGRRQRSRTATSSMPSR